MRGEGRGGEGREEEGRKGEGRDGGGKGWGGRGRVAPPQAKACPPELFFWRRRCDKRNNVYISQQHYCFAFSRISQNETIKLKTCRKIRKSSSKQ